MVRNSHEDVNLLEVQDPDARCMLQVRDGSDEAFERLLRRYQAPVRSYLAQRLHDRDRAEDLTQEVFLRVFRARGTYVPRSKFSTWLFTIVNNVAANAYRYRTLRREFAATDGCPATALPALDALALQDEREEPLHRLERAEARGKVRLALSQLNARQRTAIDLCKLRGLSYAEVAEQMSISTKAVKSLLNRARTSLRDELLEYMEPAGLAEDA